MEIREARRSDWPAIETLFRSAFRAECRTTAEVLLGIEGLDDKLRSLLEEFDAIGSRFLIAFEGEPGGPALGAILARLPEPGRVWVEDLAVAPEARGKGVAAELFAAAAPAEAEVCCEVNLRNEAGVEALRALGLERIIETAVYRRPMREAET